MATTEDAFAAIKEKQRESWSFFAPVELFTAPPAAHLVRVARIGAGQRVLDVATGTGVVALTAARLGAQVTGLDLTPALLERARENAALAELAIDWREGDVEALPFAEASFDVVVSQFGHMFAPRADVALAQMLRVLKPGGTLAFSTWPPEHFVGRFFALVARYSPPPPPGMSAPVAWGEVAIVRQRLGDAVAAVRFDRGVMRSNTLSVQHLGRTLEETIGPLRALVRSGDVQTIARYRAEFRELA
ncbi:MAG TPA: class I SAM-dependent methyltransferase, partial [Polyangia bacterium]